MSDEAPLVRTPEGGIPPVVASEDDLQRVADSLSRGQGPVAIDAERASGFRYSQRAYLIQLNRRGSGTHLIDPTAFEGLALIQEVVGEVPWIVHAASQDLVCLAEVGLLPESGLFDTELSGRLLGLPRVGLGTLVEQYLNVNLAKEHSAADWSTRPLPDDWLAYAALDVHYLADLWELVSTDLHDTNKYDFAVEEFEHVRLNTTPIERDDPWRRTSGLHKVRRPADLAVVRELWHARDAIAAEVDRAPGRVLSDAALVAAALLENPSRTAIRALPEMSTRGARRNLDEWINAVLRARDLSTHEWPEAAPRTGPGIPPPKVWAERNPDAWRRLEAARAGVAELSETLQIPVENLMSPELVRRIMWQGPSDEAELEAMLDAGKARAWQRTLVLPVLKSALSV